MSPPPTDQQAPTSPASPEPCCICMELVDYQGTLLVQCSGCAIRVHVKCYGTSVTGDAASSWLCQACEYKASAPAKHLSPQCAVCPTAGGALRLTNQRDVWCHVLCINWIPELYHSLSGVMDEAVDISLLDKNRSTLRCVVCGVRSGSCIQCVSGRCARAFHVSCAFRAPSSLIYTGYNTENQQVYHCKAHLSDVSSTKFEMVDDSWRKLSHVKKYVEAHPATTEPKCRWCSAKVTLPNKEGHEMQCLLSWVARYDALKRKEEVARVGIKPCGISYNAKSPSKKGKSRSKSSPNARKNTRESKYKRQESTTRPCPACGEHLKESQLQGHQKNSCPKSQNAIKRKMSPRNGLQDDGEVVDLTDVLFASWPGQNSGAPMDSTYFWKVVENHFYSSNVLQKKRMEQLTKSLCGVKLSDIPKARKRQLKVSDLHCRDTMRLDRNPEDSKQTLVLNKVAHKCDFIMRASHCRCLGDHYAKPMIEICHNPKCSKPVTKLAADSVVTNIPEDAAADIRVQFKSGENTALDCNYSLRVSRNDVVMNQEAADTGTVANYFFEHDAFSTLTGFEMHMNKVLLAPNNKLLVSLDSYGQGENNQGVKTTESNSQVSSVTVPGATPLTDELTPAINLLMEHLKERMEKNRYHLRALHKRLEGTESTDNKFRVSAQITDMYYREFASWKRLCASLLIGFKSGDQIEKDEKKPAESDEGSTPGLEIGPGYNG